MRGAIIVTFLFVIMLAQQAGATNYDGRSRHPVGATFMAFILLGTMLYGLQLAGGCRADRKNGPSATMSSASPGPAPN